MEKKLVMLVGILGFVLFGSMFISAVCCEKLIDGGQWCQAANDQSMCDNNYNIFPAETCDALDVPECNGVCISESSGKCEEGMGKARCSEEGGIWSQEQIGNILACQDVCCVMGKQIAFATPTECRQIFSLYDVNGTIRDDIKDRSSCEALGASIEEGACVIETETETKCKRTAETDCDNYKNNLPDGILQLPYARNEIYIHWEKGFLCSGSREVGGQVEYISGCTRTANTMCEDGKVYFTDSCGNKANVYDMNKYDSPDYWTYIYNPSDREKVCQISGPSSTCGNCDVIASGSVCTAGNTRYGNLVCGDLSCNYKGETKKHGERWCGGTAGTLVPILYNFSESEILQSSRNSLEDQNEYNLPGSRYYRMQCAFGEILIEECADYRNQICVQGDDSRGVTQAICTMNKWRFCEEYSTKSDCENPFNHCKWVSGYRWDLTTVNEKNDGKRDEEQGSCVPLIAPGFDFWKSTTQGSALCERATVQEYALYETTWWISRDDFAYWGDKTQSRACLNGCYAIPEYASDFETGRTNIECDTDENCGAGNKCFSGYCVKEELYNFYDESGYSLQDNVENYFLSDRRGQYCNKDGKPDEWLTGQVTGSSYDCTGFLGGDDKTERKERDFPIFLTHESWLASIVEKSRSLGDCGNKSNIDGEYGSETEIVTAIFEKLKQSGEVKEKIVAEQIIYKGDKNGLKWTGDETIPYNEGLYDVVEYSCVETGGMCIAEFNMAGGENCPGEKISEATCPAQKICCAYEALG